MVNPRSRGIRILPISLLHHWFSSSHIHFAPIIPFLTYNIAVPIWVPPFLYKINLSFNIKGYLPFISFRGDRENKRWSRQYKMKECVQKKRVGWERTWGLQTGKCVNKFMKPGPPLIKKNKNSAYHNHPEQDVRVTSMWFKLKIEKG